MVFLPSRKSTSRPEEVAVIGGGLEGCLAALFAARVKNPDGSSKYHVTLIEAKDKILSGSSEIAARLHLGGEYPKDLQTGKDCLWGAALWKLLLPHTGIFTSNKFLMRFLIANETQQKGDVTIESYKDYYTQIQNEYRHVIDHIYTQLKDNPAALSQMGLIFLGNERSDKYRLMLELFGAPEAFYRELHGSDLKLFEGRIAGGLQTTEPGLDIPRYLSAIEQAVKEAGVKIITGQRVQRIDEQTRGKPYALQCVSGRSFKADQLIQAAWEGGFALDGPHRSEPQHKKLHVYQRAMALVDIHNIPAREMPGSSFVLKDNAGGMFCPINANFALVYHPTTAHLADVELDSADARKRSVPADWKKPLGPKVKQELLSRYKKALVEGPFPFLAKAEFKDVIVRPTLNFQQSIDQRRHEPTQEIKPGYHALYATKLTLAPQSAIEAVEQLKKRSQMRAEGVKDVLLLPPRPMDALNVALQDATYHLKNVLEPSTRTASDFAQRHQLPFSAAASDTIRWPYEQLPNPQSSRSKNVRKQTDILFEPYSVPVYTKTGPTTGYLFDDNEATHKKCCKAIDEWEHSGSGPLTDVALMTPKRLANGIYNRLLHADREELSEWHQLLVQLPSEERKLFFNTTRVPEEMRLSFINSINYRRRGAVTRMQNTGPTVLPMLFGTLSEEEQARVATAITLLLHEQGADKAFFAPLANSSLNSLEVEREKIPLLTTGIINSGRSLHFDLQDAKDCKPVPFVIRFQNKDFYPAHFSFHRNTQPVRGTNTASGSKSEAFKYVLYDDPKHERRCRRGGEKDPNDISVGELHAIFIHQDTSGEPKALAICAQVKLGEENKAMDRYIAPLRQLNRPLKITENALPKGASIPFDPLDCFNHSQFSSAQKFLKAPLSPPFMDEPLFYGGMHVVHLPPEQSVTISSEQLKVLETAQPELESAPVGPYTAAASRRRGPEPRR